MNDSERFTQISLWTGPYKDQEPECIRLDNSGGKKSDEQIRQINQPLVTKWSLSGTKLREPTENVKIFVAGETQLDEWRPTPPANDFYSSLFDKFWADLNFPPKLTESSEI